MRKKKALINSLFSIVLELVTVIAGFILPRLFIRSFGSETNGLISSVSSFIGYITLLQSGAGTAAKTAMYKPLAKKDHEQLCITVHTIDCFFRKIAKFTVVYIGILAFLFPSLIAPDAGSFAYTASLVVILGISTAAQYFFGITYQMLLEADQRSYISTTVQIVSVAVNALISVILIKCGCSVQTVKLGSAAVYVIRPVVLRYYAVKRYKLTDNVPVDNSFISQRWDAFTQGMAYFIHSKTDVFVLTMYARLSGTADLSIVSVYSIYALVTTGLSSVIQAIGKAVTSAFGNIIANDEKENLRRTFTAYNTMMHILCTAVFATASVTVFNFVGIYTKGITDIDYMRRSFGVLIIFAEYLYCVRLPYINVINAAGKFKETKIPAVLEAVINIIVSVVLVGKFGLVGVAVGTAAAMAYRIAAFVRYLSKNVLEFSIISQVKKYLISFSVYFVLNFAAYKLPVNTENYFEWFLYAGCVFAISSVVTFSANLLFAGSDTRFLINMVFRKKARAKNT